MPLSPHLPIYRVQITSLLSITHRLTEMVIYGMGMLFSLGTAMIAFSLFPAFTIPVHGVLIYGALMLMNIALAYHLTSTMRYLFWDMGYGFDHVTLTGWLSVIGGVVLGLVPFGILLFF